MLVSLYMMISNFPIVSADKPIADSRLWPNAFTEKESISDNNKKYVFVLTNEQIIWLAKFCVSV